MLTPEQHAAWDRDGYFVIRGFAPEAVGRAMENETIAAIRANPPTEHPGETAWFCNDLIIMPEPKPMEGVVNPEDQIAKVFNTHLSGAARDFARDKRIGDIVAGVLDNPDIDVFQSQFIFKNRGAWGQPWHQDSHYFPFVQQPQVGVWLAISEATIENGCLWVLPGSHKAQEIYHHGPDLRPGAKHLGYLEVADQDFGPAIPMTMEPGDLLVFHSYLLHKSVDNCSKGRRSAMVYHYGRAGTEFSDGIQEIQKMVLRFQPVRRQAAAA
jgi:phytanoyl-CoA hydroxylase